MQYQQYAAIVSLTNYRRKIAVNNFLITLLFGLFLVASTVATQVRADQNKALYDAVLFQEIPQLKSLLQSGADPNFTHNNRSLLGWAAQGGSAEVVEMLTKAGADPNVADGVGHTPLMRAVETMQIEIIAVLLAANVDTDIATNEGKTAAMLAVATGNPAIVQSLVDAGADFNTKDVSGNTVVMNAVSYSVENLPEIIRVLGKAGADMNSGSDYSTPLFYAVEQGDGTLVDALLEAGADPNVKAGEGNAPLLSAFSYPGIARRLIEAGADPNITNRWGDSALFTAIDNGTVEEVRMLVEAGADVNLKNNDGQTPLHRANTLVREDMAALLKQHGATESGGAESPAGTAETASAQPSGVTSAPTQSANRGSLAGFPVVAAVQTIMEGGATLMYFSSASFAEALGFYDKALSERGFEKASEYTDDETYASSSFSRDGSFYSMALGLDPSSAPPRVSVTVSAHGKHSARKLPRPAESEPVFEDNHTAIYVLDEDPKPVADKTLALLLADGWQGGLNEANNLQILNMSKDNTRLSVMVQVAPAQNNRTTIHYSLILEN